MGLATALALIESGVRSTVVLEAEDRLAAHQSGHNSGVIHSGLYYRPGSLRARTCVEGREAMYRFCAEEGVPCRRCGKIVAAARPAQVETLRTLEERGRANGLRDLRRLDGPTLRELEPALRGVEGLWVGETGVVDYGVVAAAMARRIRAGGGEIRTGARVTGVASAGSDLAVTTTSGVFEIGRLVNCAGLQSDRVARLCGLRPSVRIVPFRGEYYLLRPERSSLVRHLVYPVPDPTLPFLGVHFTRRIDDRVEAGPNAVLAFHREGYRRWSVSVRDMAETLLFPGFWRMAARHWRAGVMEWRRSLSKARFVRSLQELVPEVREEDLVPGGAGVRAQAIDRAGQLVDDFQIDLGERSVHVLNAPSPAATASLVIGRTVAAQVLGSLPSYKDS